MSEEKVVAGLSEGVGIVGPVVSGIARDEIDMAIATARRFPRSIEKFRAEVMALATLDEETAGECFYSLPARGDKGKPIEGPSVRLAEIVAHAWGNIRYGARVVEVAESYVTAQGVAYDLERNVPYSIEVRRKILTHDGRRYGEDMINVTGRAACAIAKREAVFGIVPPALFKEAYLAAREASIGKSLTMAQRRERAFKWCEEQGIKTERVLHSLGRPGISEVSVSDLHRLTGLRTAIRDGETTIDEAFPVVTTPRERVVTPDSILSGVVKVEERGHDQPRQTQCDHATALKHAKAHPGKTVICGCGEEVKFLPAESNSPIAPAKLSKEEKERIKQELDDIVERVIPPDWPTKPHQSPRLERVRQVQREGLARLLRGDSPEAVRAFLVDNEIAGAALFLAETQEEQARIEGGEVKS